MTQATYKAACRLNRAILALEPLELDLRKALENESGVELSKLIGVSGAFISDVKNGNRKVSVGFVKRIVEAGK